MLCVLVLVVITGERGQVARPDRPRDRRARPRDHARRAPRAAARRHRVRRGNFSFYFPIVTSIILSILLTLILASSDADAALPKQTVAAGPVPSARERAKARRGGGAPPQARKRRRMSIKSRSLDQTHGARAPDDRAVRRRAGARAASSPTACRRTATTCASATNSRSSRTSTTPSSIRRTSIPKSFVDIKADVCIIPPNSFALASTIEYFRIPRDILTVCLGQVHLRPLRDHRQRHAVRAGVGRARDHRDLEHDAAARQDLRERRHRPGALLPERRAVHAGRTRTRRASTRRSAA